jgi:O-succinylbenzoic acid--CoA ligase
MTNGPSRALLASAARRNAADFGDSPAVIAGSTTWTWRQLDAMADAVAAGLLASGLQAHDRVALLARSSGLAIALLHGAARVGVVVVPLNERLSSAEMTILLASVDVKHVVAAADFATSAKCLAAKLLVLDDLASLANLAPAAPAAAFADDPAVIVATSGSTGLPKGALLTHGQMAASAAAWNAFLPAATGWLASLSLGHVGGLGIVWRAALAGVPIVVPATGDHESLHSALGKPPVSHASVVAVQLARLLDRGGVSPDGLRALLLGGGPISADLVARAISAGFPLVPTYGMTESASGVTALPTAEAAARPGSSGKTLAGVELRIARPAEDGVGDIEVRGPSLFAGYVRRASETAAAFTTDGWYRTGDLGRLDDDGYLAVADRRLDLIVSGGENVYPAEVEAVLMSHPAIADAGVAGRPDAKWGAVPLAGVVLRAGAAATDEEVLAYCRQHLARFKVPSRIVFLAELPRVGAGKLHREALRSLLAEQPPSLPATAPSPTLPSVRHLDRPDGFRLAYRLLERPVSATPDQSVVLILHATLSSGWQIRQLASLLAQSATVILPDRRGSGASRLEVPRPVSLAEHVADARALLDEFDVGRVTVFGHSFGAIVALALAAAHPDRVAAVIAYEPPLLDVVDTSALGRPATIAKLVLAAHAAGGAPAAAVALLHAIGGDEVLGSASAATRAAILDEGDGVLADVGSIDAAAVTLSGVICPVTLVTGDESEPFYAQIADAAATSLPRADRVRLPGLGHNAPITQPAAIAELVRSALVRD